MRSAVLGRDVEEKEGGGSLGGSRWEQGGFNPLFQVVYSFEDLLVPSKSKMEITNEINADNVKRLSRSREIFLEARIITSVAFETQGKIIGLVK